MRTRKLRTQRIKRTDATRQRTLARVSRVCGFQEHPSGGHTSALLAFDFKTCHDTIGVLAILTRVSLHVIFGTRHRPDSVFVLVYPVAGLSLLGIVNILRVVE